MSMSITRRTALKSLAAIALAPTVQLRRDHERERILSRFAGDPGCCSRYDVEAPFQHGSLTYATDARTICRAELATAPLVTGERRLPDVATCWATYWRPAGPFRPFWLPPHQSLTLSDPHGGTCPECDDRRISHGDHYPQDLDDELRNFYDYDPDDNTSRDKSCPLCRGRTWRGPCELVVAGVLMSYSRLKPIAAIPDVRVVRSEHDSACLLFCGDGFEGMAMGIVR